MVNSKMGCIETDMAPFSLGLHLGKTFTLNKPPSEIRLGFVGSTESVLTYGH